MAASQTISWEYPWSLGSVVTGPGGLGDEDTTIDSGSNFIGGYPGGGALDAVAEVNLYFTLAIPKTVTATLYSKSGLVQYIYSHPLPAGPNAISLLQLGEYVSALEDLYFGWIVLELPGASAGTPDTLTNVTLFPGALTHLVSWYSVAAQDYP